MSIRLNKVTKEFNIGLQTAVEFLQKKGFNEVEANPNYKITEEQYAALQGEFSSDKGLRKEATQLIQQHIGQTKERKETPKPKPVEEVQIEAPKVAGPKILGRIDLGEQHAETPKAEKAPAAKPKKKAVVEEKKPEPKPVAKEKVKTEPAPAPAPKEEELPVTPAPKDQPFSLPTALFLLVVTFPSILSSPEPVSFSNEELMLLIPKRKSPIPPNSCNIDNMSIRILSILCLL